MLHELLTIPCFSSKKSDITKMLLISLFFVKNLDPLCPIITIYVHEMLQNKSITTF